MDETKSYLTIPEITTILESGEFEKLVGVKESACFEAKPQHPFDLTLEKKTNLSIAKYFASFANNEGGIIVFGLVIESDETHLTDVVKEINLFAEKDFYNPKELIERGQATTHPKLDGIVAKWCPSRQDKNLGLGMVFIPKQDDRKKYFMMTGNKEIEGEEIQGEFYGIPIRNGAQTDWLPAQKVHELSRQRPRDWQEMGTQIFDRLDGIDEKLSKIQAQPLGSSFIVHDEKFDALMKEVFKRHE